MMKLAVIACLIAMAAAAAIEAPAKLAPEADERSDETKLLLAQKEPRFMVDFRDASPQGYGGYPPYGYGGGRPGGYPYGGAYAGAGYPYGGAYAGAGYPYGTGYPYAGAPISVLPSLIPPIGAGFSIGK